MEAVKVKNQPTCYRCGMHSIMGGECLSCGHPYNRWQDYGRRGGKATVANHEPSYMKSLARTAGRPRLPTLAELQGQLPAPEKNNGKEDELPNDRKKLMALWLDKYKRGEGMLLATTSPRKGGMRETTQLNSSRVNENKQVRD